MNVILLERIRHLGELGDQVQVKPGYGRNFLIPAGKAVVATPENVEIFEARRAQLEEESRRKMGLDEDRAKFLDGLEVTIRAHSGEEGKLYGSVGAVDIVKAVETAGGKVSKQEIQLPHGSIRSLGEYDVAIRMHHGDILATLKVKVESDTADPQQS